jgi:hypothetical protein
LVTSAYKNFRIAARVSECLLVRAIRYFLQIVTGGFRHDAIAEVGVVEIESHWTADRRKSSETTNDELRVVVPTSVKGGQM